MQIKDFKAGDIVYIVEKKGNREALILKSGP